MVLKHKLKCRQTDITCSCALMFNVCKLVSRFSNIFMLNQKYYFVFVEFKAIQLKIDN